MKGSMFRLYSTLTDIFTTSSNGLLGPSLLF